MMVKWLRVSAEGSILSSGQASPQVAALQRQAPGERLFTHDQAADVDDARLKVDLTALTLIAAQSEHEGTPGDGAALIEII